MPLGGAVLVHTCCEPDCKETGTLSVGGECVCRSHYLSHCYRRLGAIAEEIKNNQFNHDEGEAASRFLQDCMRSAADVASTQDQLTNLERAQIFDILLWSSELHGRLRRSPRRVAKFPILLRSDIPGRCWEERVETKMVSRHGMRISCRSDVRLKDTLTCTRLDNGRRAEAVVAWTSRNSFDEVEAGLEFSRDDNFWGLVWGEPTGGGAG
jgi:hypothetical protein